jgi:phosphate transport system ATP-binding protein
MGVGIKVDKLNAWFGKTQALHDITMDAPANHATAVIGPSGCGKSTFVRCLNRMHETVPDARATGSVQIGELDVYNGTSAVQIRRRIGMVFQKPNPFPTMSIYDNVAAGLKLNGFHDHKRLDEIVERSLKLSALWDEVKDTLRKKSGASLSGGQQQRLCIARALAVEPQVLLMDEPCSALDPISTGKIEELIFQLKEKFTIVIVTHNMQQASRVAEFTGFFLLGKLIELDKTEKIFTTPSDKRTEDYITGRFGKCAPAFNKDWTIFEPVCSAWADWLSRPWIAPAKPILTAIWRAATWCSKANSKSTWPNGRSTNWHSIC